MCIICCILITMSIREKEYYQENYKENTFTVLDIFIEKNTHRGGLAQFKLVLVKGQLYFTCDFVYICCTSSPTFLLSCSVPTHFLWCPNA